jgi:flagellar assembly protein FliH
MIRILALEDFQPIDMSGPAMASESEDTGNENQEATLAAFDEGYRNGWDDCAKAEAETHRRIATDLAANLQDISLTYAEARQDVLNSLGPLFEDIAAQLLPSLAAEAIAPVVVAELQAAAHGAARGRAVLIASPSALPALERLIAEQGLPEVDLHAEPAYAEGQVSIRFDDERRDIDLSGAAQRMAEAIRSFVALEIEPSLPAPIRKGVA